ncbi:MAG: hypothetical protein J5I90_19420 [Caldilineales bacterium]|nr:hypothetical protein [Caldilineales bacterium]
MTANPIAKRHAAGIVFCPSADGFEVALVGFGERYHLPQAEVEPGKSVVAAAVQAVWEQVHVRALAGPIIDQVEQWSQKRKGEGWTQVRELVDYVLMEGIASAEERSETATPRVHWLPIDKAIAQAANSTEREMLTRARSLLRAPGSGLRLLPSIMAHALGDLSPATLLALAETELWVDDEIYVVLALPSGERPSLVTQGEPPYLATIDDGDELTLVVSERTLEAHPDLFAQSIQAERSFRFIRLEANLPWDTVGYGAAIFAALTAAGISAGFYSGYSIDYLLIKEVDLALGLASLERLIREAQALSATALEDNGA